MDMSLCAIQLELCTIQLDFFGIILHVDVHDEKKDRSLSMKQHIC